MQEVLGTAKIEINLIFRMIIDFDKGFPYIKYLLSTHAKNFFEDEMLKPEKFEDILYNLEVLPDEIILNIYKDKTFKQVRESFEEGMIELMEKNPKEFASMQGEIESIAKEYRLDVLEEQKEADTQQSQKIVSQIKAKLEV